MAKVKDMLNSILDSLSFEESMALLVHELGFTEAQALKMLGKDI